MADDTGKADDEFYDDVETMGDDPAERIAAPDDTGEPGDAVQSGKYPLTPERGDYDLKNRGTLSEVEGSEYEPDNDLEANIETSDEQDDSRG